MPTAMIDAAHDQNATGLRGLSRQVKALRRSVAAEGRRTFGGWRGYIHRPAFAASALNLAHYRALRHRDIRPLQHSLMRYGLSSLGRLEGRVLAALDAVGAVLDRAVQGDRPPFPSE